MKPNINVTPLIDVLLVLLIIFMVITPAAPSAFKAKLPAAPTGPQNLPPHPNYLVVTVGPDRTLAVNRDAAVGTIEDAGEVTARLREIFERRAADGVMRPDSNEIEKTVFIRAPKSLSYGSVAQVVDAVKLAGAEPIGLQLDNLGD